MKGSLLRILFKKRKKKNTRPRLHIQFILQKANGFVVGLGKGRVYGQNKNKIVSTFCPTQK